MKNYHRNIAMAARGLNRKVNSIVPRAPWLTREITLPSSKSELLNKLERYAVKAAPRPDVIFLQLQEPYPLLNKYGKRRRELEQQRMVKIRSIRLSGEIDDLDAVAKPPKKGPAIRHVVKYPTPGKGSGFVHLRMMLLMKQYIPENVLDNEVFVAPTFDRLEIIKNDAEVVWQFYMEGRYLKSQRFIANRKPCGGTILSYRELVALWSMFDHVEGEEPQPLGFRWRADSILGDDLPALQTQSLEKAQAFLRAK